MAGVNRVRSAKRNEKFDHRVQPAVRGSISAQRWTVVMRTGCVKQRPAWLFALAPVVFYRPCPEAKDAMAQVERESNESTVFNAQIDLDYP